MLQNLSSAAVVVGALRVNLSVSVDPVKKICSRNLEQFLDCPRTSGIIFEQFSRKIQNKKLA